MNRTLVLALVSSTLFAAACSTCAGDEPPPTLADVAAEYGRRTHELAERLLAGHDHGRNTCLSPVAVQHVAALLHRGAAGRTRSELEAAFGFGGNGTPPLTGTAWLVPRSAPASFRLGMLAVDNDGYGLTVESIAAGSPAAEAGIAVGDLLLAIDGLPTIHEADFASAVDYSTGRIEVTLFDHDRGAVERRVVELAGGTGTPAAPGSGTISFRTGLWVADDAHLRPEFAADMKRIGSELQSVPFTTAPETAIQRINSWATKSGFGDDPILDDSDVPPETRAVVVNVLVVSSPWERRFDPDATRPRPFRVSNDRSVEVPTMQQVGEMRCALGGTFDAVELPLEHPRLCAVLVRTRDGKRPEVEEVRRSLERRFVTLRVPRFSLRNRLDLAATLRRMEVQRAFDPARANFSSLADEPLRIDRAQQQCRLTFDEHGLDARAGTVVTLVPRSEVEGTIAFDSPFDCFVIDRTTRAILFAAHVADPSVE